VVAVSLKKKTLKTEVEKGSMRTAFGHGLLDPKAKDNSIIQVVVYDSGSKGNEVNIPQAGRGVVILRLIHARAVTGRGPKGSAWKQRFFARKTNPLRRKY